MTDALAVASPSAIPVKWDGPANVGPFLCTAASLTAPAAVARSSRWQSAAGLWRVDRDRTSMLAAMARYGADSVEGRGMSPPGAAITPSLTSTPIQSAFAWCNTILPSTIRSISKTLQVRS